ncbi:hypothetical protein CRUP_026694 [Coryphaenoides rupestris]|nr:hypothetical protein CRUP_026694 [Coryphaenoides rupestris]
MKSACLRQVWAGLRLRRRRRGGGGPAGTCAASCSRAKSSHQESQDLRSSLVASQRREEETGGELERRVGQIRAYEEELQQLPVVRAELQRTAAELSDLRDRHRATEALRDSQGLQLQTLKVQLSVQESSVELLQASLQQREEEVRLLQEELRLLQETLGRREDELHAGEMERRRLHNTIQELKMQALSGAPAAGGLLQVCFPGAQSSLLDGLNRQREEGQLCDLSIQVQGQVFHAHRCVLAASSSYFHDQVLLKNMSTVCIPAVMDPLAFEGVLSCAYTGRLCLAPDDIVNYLTVGSVLQMWHIVDKCTQPPPRRGRGQRGRGRTGR